MDSSVPNHARHDPPDTAYLPSYTPRTREAPPSGPPPAYAAVLGKVYPYTLRPVILFTTFVTFLYLLLISISQFKDAAGFEVSGKLMLFYIIQGSLLLLVALVEVLGFVAAFRSNLKLATVYSRIALPSYILVVAAQILAVVSHYTCKRDFINACTAQNTGKRVSSGDSFWWNSSTTSYTLSGPEAESYCQDQWNSESTWTIVWLVVVLIVGVPFVMFSFAFARQLRDPASVRVRVQPVWNWGRNNHQQAPSSQYAQGPYDPQAQSYAMGAYPPPPAGPYARPPGPPPPDGNDLPDYQRGPHVGEDDFNDRKSSIGGRQSDGYGYSVGYGERPGSSRGGDARENDAAKDSQVTVTLDDDDKKGGTRTKTRDHGDDDDDDDGPRV
ncbi:uncharacterized protein PFL1_04981 [Pseudozyma flocculosa PF-1]|uniref:Transmembrane protein n=2 Tax=Pseudozyma flocculosa TaxID=84751 RepID=A0A5C3EV18_9BASI|nr:uncharacterized protein PFL1_04981 [Pseudozyma flocculosa PF-1]EPQ27443.1 hypothetical protein PFL1_04981 [Pseudozyma flocculosa PF-1]SPO36128.1 uncharacterized protein PSFLO_01599 [Pseudozyma flocculosa]